MHCEDSRKLFCIVENPGNGCRRSIAQRGGVPGYSGKMRGEVFRRGIQGIQVVFRGFQGYSGVFRGIQGFSGEVFRVFRGIQGIQRGTQAAPPLWPLRAIYSMLGSPPQVLMYSCIDYVLIDYEYKTPFEVVQSLVELLAQFVICILLRPNCCCCCCCCCCVPNRRI